VSAAGFSLVLNLLMLVLALFMLQVFDRVLTSRSIETLIMLLDLCAKSHGPRPALSKSRESIVSPHSHRELFNTFQACPGI
jgi:ABC-type protease/lipase transport system fused ATPase/permease subunit